MNWLFDNPVSEMPGPLFLGLYAVVIVLVLMEARWRVRREDRSGSQGPEPIPKKPDPVEIAYLRGGANEVTRLLVFDLIRRGYLHREEKTKRFTKAVETKIGQAADPADLASLSPVEAEAFDYFRKSRNPAELFQPGGLSSLLLRATTPLKDSLREARLLAPRDQIEAAWRSWYAGALMILAFGGFKLFIASAKGNHNVAFLFVFAGVGLVGLAIACWVPRLTRRGQEYLANLRDAFEGLKPRIAQPVGLASDDPALALVPAVFGVAVLSGTPYSYAPDMFKAAASSGSCGGGGCGGGGCGGGGCGGGGCGGGCGGCGG